LSISEVKRKLNEYDAIFKSDNKAVLNNTNNRPIRSVNLKNQLNSFLIEYLFNQTNAENRQQTTNLADLVLKNTKKAGGNSNFDNYQNLVDNFLRVSKLSLRSLIYELFKVLHFFLILE
jgi:hypothetical protein